MIICVINCHPSDRDGEGWTFEIWAEATCACLTTHHLGLDVDAVGAEGSRASGRQGCPMCPSFPRPSVTRDSYLLLNVCKKTRPSCQLLRRCPCCDLLQNAEVEQNLRLVEGGRQKKEKLRGGAKSIPGTPVYFERGGEGSEGTPFNADRPRRRWEGAKFAEIYSPENRRERIHVLGMRSFADEDRG